MNTLETPGSAGPSEALPTWLAGALGVSPDEPSLSSGLSTSATWAELPRAATAVAIVTSPLNGAQ
ncbi:MAG: hypothetical protein KGI71_06285, partial [Patescibacteria group bacterium]|nr:hypothetical protein [Patescibacteria group bacterium]